MGQRLITAEAARKLGRVPLEPGFNLSLPAAVCPSCDEPRPPGPCPECGTQVPEADDESAVVTARQKALGPLLREAAEIAELLPNAPAATVPLGVDQLARSVSELELLTRAGHLAVGVAERFSELDLDDQAQIGSTVRQSVRAELDRIRELVDDFFEISRFQTKDPGPTLVNEIAKLLGWALEVCKTTLTAATTDSWETLQDAQSSFADFLGESPSDSDLWDELPRRLDEAADPDDNARIARVVGRSGAFTDEFGLITAQTMITVLEDQQAGEMAREYLERAIGVKDQVGAEYGRILAPVAVNLSVLDAPLVAHRALRALHGSLNEAWVANPAEVTRVIQGYALQGQLAMEAAAKIQRSFRQLARSEEASIPVEDESWLDYALSSYLDVAETSFRAIGSAAANLDRISRGDDPVYGDDDPLVGDLVQTLTGKRAGKASLILGKAVDADLRNTLAHSRDRWDRDAQQVVDARKGHRWSVDDLSRRMDSLVGVVTGADAAASHFALSHDLELEVPWLLDGTSEAGTFAATSMICSAQGVPISAVTNAGETIRIREGAEVDYATLVKTAGGLRAVGSAVADSISFESHDGADELVSVGVAALDRFSKATGPVKQLALVEIFYDAAVRGGADQGERARIAAAAMATMIGTTSLEDFKASQAAASFENLDAQLRYALQALDRFETVPEDVRRLRKKLERTKGTSQIARRRPDQMPEMGKRLYRLVKWGLDRTGSRCLDPPSDQSSITVSQ